MNFTEQHCWLHLLWAANLSCGSCVSVVLISILLCKEPDMWICRWDATDCNLCNSKLCLNPTCVCVCVCDAQMLIVACLSVKQAHILTRISFARMLLVLSRLSVNQFRSPTCEGFTWMLLIVTCLSVNQAQARRVNVSFGCYRLLGG